MAAAADGAHAPLAEVVGQLVAALGLAGHHGDPHQVGRLVEVERLELLLDDLDVLEIGCGERGNQSQVEVVGVLGTLEALNLQTFRRDEQQLHDGTSLAERVKSQLSLTGQDCLSSPPPLRLFVI